MLYPSIQQITHGEVNRYRLVIATSKCARHVNSLLLKEQENIEKSKETGADKSEFSEYPVKKPVSIAVMKLADGEYKINEKD